LRFDTAGRLVAFGKGTEAGGSGLDGITQYAATSAISFVGQSGSAAVSAP
jgi:hypothetical protein